MNVASRNLPITAVLILTMLMGGCATLGYGKKAENAAKQQTEAFCKALVDQDLTAVAGLVSDHFTHYEWQDKAGMMTFLENAKASGDLNDMKVDMNDTEFKEDSRRVSVFPVDLQGRFGTVTIELVFRKEWKHWKIIKLRATGL